MEWRQRKLVDGVIPVIQACLPPWCAIRAMELDMLVPVPPILRQRKAFHGLHQYGGLFDGTIYRSSSILLV